MEDRKSKILSVLLIVLAWLIAIAFAYLVFRKIRILTG
jgi:hypothetical protein